jgi:AcrR family transcriptional regulator
MVQNLEDLRIRRTRKLLQEAMIELAAEKGFAEISVRDITERAMVNRSTFYRHYLDKYDLLDQYMTEVFAFAPKDHLEEQWHRSGEVPNALHQFLLHVQEFAGFYRVMLGAKGDTVFIQRFRQEVEKRFRSLLNQYETEPDPNAPPIELRLSYISCADIGAILWWLENDQPCSAQDLAMWIGKLASASAGLPYGFKRSP